MQILTFILLKEEGLEHNGPKVYVSIEIGTGSSL